MELFGRRLRRSRFSNLIIGGFLLISAVLYWFVKRKINYSLMYGDQVRASICEMVKAEHLTEYGAQACRELQRE